jgi:hypothetical protein
MAGAGRAENNAMGIARGIDGQTLPAGVLFPENERRNPLRAAE